MQVSDAITSARLELVSMSAEFLAALLAGDRAEAQRLAGVTIPDDWPDEHDEGFLRLRLQQTRHDPELEQWLVRALVLPARGRPMIGHAGFHGKPGTNALRKPGAVEIGYTIFQPYRGRGYATEAVAALLEWARTQRGVERFVASVAPGNASSLAIVRKLGFEQTGAVWDEEDGEELVFELSAGT